MGSFLSAIGFAVALLAVVASQRTSKSLVERLTQAKQVRRLLSEGASAGDIVSELGCSARVVLAIERSEERRRTRLQGGD